ELARALPRADARFLDNRVRARAADAIEGVHQELANRAGIAFGEKGLQSVERNLLRARYAAEGQAHFDLKRSAAIDRRRLGLGGVALAGNDVGQAFQNQGLANGTEAVRCRRTDLGVLNRLKEGISFLPADSLGVGSRADLGAFADIAGDGVA